MSCFSHLTRAQTLAADGWLPYDEAVRVNLLPTAAVQQHPELPTMAQV